jgi:glycosyltransferase involved in cell wall biosynthesis
MNIFDFTTDKDSDKEYPYKILVYPNITYMRDLEKDSYVVVLRNVIKELNKIRNDIHWTILSPGDIKSLTFENTTQIPINLPSYPNAMRCHFNYNEIKANLRWKHTDYDVVYSHLPEHTLNMTNLLENDTNISPKYVGYCHWYEVDENTNYSKRMLMDNYNGMLEMEECGVNSIWLKELVLEKAKKYYNDEIISKLDKIIQPHYLGIDKINNVEVPTKKKTIIFNHRDNYYTGWTWFIDSMDELYKQRQDFTVYTTLADLDRPYAKRVKISDRDEYLDFIRSMHVGVGTFQKYSAWSISTTDSLSMGVPYILPNKLCYPEMVGKDYPLLYEGRDGFLQKLNGALDDDGSVDKAKTYLKTKIQEFPWANRVPQWFDGWNFLTPDSFDMIGEKSESYPKIVDFIHKKKSVTKKEILDYLGWGVRISFSPYRNRLRTEPTIKFTKNRYEVR